MKRVAFLAIIFASILVGCSPGSGGPTTGKKEPVVANAAKSASDLLPLTEGNAWTYYIESEIVAPNGQSERSNTTRILKIGKVSKDAKGTRADLLFLDDKQKLLATIRVLSNDKGLYQTGVQAPNRSAQNFSVPLLWAPFPYKLDETIKWTGTGPFPGIDGQGQISAGITGRGPAEADTMTGRFKCERIESVQMFSTNKMKFRTEQISWFSPGVGLVRNKEVVANDQGARQSSIMLLKSYTVK